MEMRHENCHLHVLDNLKFDVACTKLITLSTKGLGQGSPSPLGGMSLRVVGKQRKLDVWREFYECWAADDCVDEMLGPWLV